MDGLTLQEDDPVVNDVNELIHDQNGFIGLDYQTNVDSLSLYNELKCCLLKLAINGADKLLMDRKLSKTNSLAHGIEPSASPRRSFSSEYGNECGSSSKNCLNFEECGFEQYSMLKENERVCSRINSGMVEPRKNSFGDTYEWKYVDVPQVVNYSPARDYSDFPFNFLAFFAVLLMKFIGFQFNLLVNFFTFPIWFSYFSFMFLMFPFQTLRHIRRYFMRKLFRMWDVSSRRVTEKAQQTMGNMTMRFGRAFFWSSYVCLMLLGFLVSGFVFGGLIMRLLVETPIQETEPLNFDYTKASPVAFVPLNSGMDYASGVVANENIDAGKQFEARVIPHNHKLQLTVSLMMPESQYNQKLGMFQVRVEFMSARGKVTASSRHPCMLRFKSKPVRIIQTIIKSAPLIAGFQSESQILNIKMNEFTEGLEPTSFLKVILEQRAEYKEGAGVPEIYAASLSLESEVPRSKRFIWHWRRTIYVWTSFVLFWTELMFVSVFCRPIIMPRARAKILHAKKEPCASIISWYKSS